MDESASYPWFADGSNPTAERLNNTRHSPSHSATLSNPSGVDCDWAADTTGSRRNGNPWLCYFNDPEKAGKTFNIELSTACPYGFNAGGSAWTFGVRRRRQGLQLGQGLVELHQGFLGCLGVAQLR